ncbi:uncharacterized protein LOC116006054 [Ipomoea triloba]|uniref:uncharacterized protein LOC116006054 n=1 Tax=Ipomoea triloba TaxID=35885 RepID=UPI00125D5833|nr:uncharacterized protein LOC116006054 [Ipomoea triloba]
MASIELLLSQARRHCPTKIPPSLSPFLRNHFHRFLSSSPESPPDNPVPKPNSRTPIQVEPVSYKPRDPPQSPPKDSSQSEPSYNARRPAEPNAPDQINPEARTWTREDLRYLKDMPTMSTVSYPTRVAPLPEEDRIMAEGEEERKERGDAELEREARRIQNEQRFAAMSRIRGEVEMVPFPTLIKVENDKAKVKSVYDLKEAIRLAKSNARTTFDETLEAHVKLTPEMRRSDLKLDGSVRLPHGWGKKFRVAVFAEGADADEARAAGADIVGGLELIQNIKNGSVKIDFDKCLATHAMMPNLKQIAKYLRQLMPDTKKGTVIKDVSNAVKEARDQGIMFKKDKTAIVHVGLGKLSFAEEALCENVGAFVNALLLAKPAGLKKSSKYAGYVNAFHICSTMGQSFQVSIQSLSIAADRHTRMHLQ